MSDYQQEVDKLMRSARGKSNGDVALLQEAARLADTHHDTALGLRVRVKLINAANFSGNYELVLVAFTWCLAQMDRDEQLKIESQRNVLWYYKWVIDSLSEYPQVSRNQIEQSLKDMTDRYQAAGYGMHAVHKCRAYSAIRLGDIDVHREARDKWLNSPDDDIADCAACETNSAVRFHLEAGELTEALQAAEPILAGRQRCSEVPCITFGALLLPLMKLGQPDRAEALHLMSIRQAMSSRDLLDTAGDHCGYLAVTGKFPKAIKVFETGIAWLVTIKRSWERMLFLQNAIVLFERLAAAGDVPLPLKIPESAAFYRVDNTYVPSAVAAALQEMIAGLIKDFNGRNGNDYMDRRYQKFRMLVADVVNAHRPE